MSELEPLPPRLSELFAEERNRPEPDPATTDRVFSRLVGTLGLPPGGGGPGGGGDGGGQPGATVPPPTGTTTGLLASIAAKPAAIALTAFALGAASTALVVSQAPTPTRAAIEPAAPRVVVVHVPSSAPSTAKDDDAIEPEDLAPEEKKPAVQVDAGPARDRSLARERALISRARTALAKRQGDAALAALSAHAREFPSGRLAEERESLRVQALVLRGDDKAAAEEAKKFEKKYPNSLLKGAVEQSLSTP